MANFEDINNALNSVEPETVKVSIVTLAGTQVHDVVMGTTVAQLKSRYGIEGTKIVDEEGDTLDNNAIIDEDTQLFISAPKKNG